MDRIKLTLDAMSVKRADTTGEGVTNLVLEEVFLGDRTPRFIIQLVSFSLAEIPTGKDLLARAERSLG